MTPVAFKGHNQVLAKNQKEYRPLPVYLDPDGIVVSCWRLTWWERATLLVTGRVWVMQKTFGEYLQPQLLATTNPLVPAPPPSAGETQK